MMYKQSCFLLSILLSTAIAYAKDVPPAIEADQQINEFSLAGYGEKGKKTWDISGKSADILTDTVKLDQVEGNLYGEKDNVNLTADKGDFDRAQGKVHLEDNVVITSTSGAKLTTDSLDWDRKNALVKTEDKVNIVRDSMVLEGTGVIGKTDLQKVALEKDVKLDIDQAASSSGDMEAGKITVTCDGPLEIDYEKNVATFKNNVKVERSELTIFSDTMDVYFLAGKDKTASVQEEGPGGLPSGSIDKIVARQNVKIVRGENVSYSEEAEYNAQSRKIILRGRPKLVIYTQEGLK